MGNTIILGLFNLNRSCHVLGKKEHDKDYSVEFGLGSDLHLRWPELEVWPFKKLPRFNADNFDENYTLCRDTKRAGYLGVSLCAAMIQAQAIVYDLTGFRHNRKSLSIAKQEFDTLVQNPHLLDKTTFYDYGFEVDLAYAYYKIHNQYLPGLM